ncbi:hypothetical protein AAG570_001313 [Ranatra chinensis]|uniref:Protein kinase domain-containing protein n=1 Tax=Ranatra chinensis TaxID=642074 RepID=A0ABD0YC82_9HEMI
MLMATKKERKDKPKPPELTLKVILSFVHQLALGMECISNHRLVHKDLAARNCLVSSDLNLKISLSALAKDTYNKEYFMYRNKYLPIRWLPYEVISEDDYSCKSDVYSFAATSWEIFMGGELPFTSQSDEEVLNMLESGTVTWTHPKSSPEDMNTLLDKCWSSNPSERPNFSYIALKIGDLMSEVNKS